MTLLFFNVFSRRFQLYDFVFGVFLKYFQRYDSVLGVFPKRCNEKAENRNVGYVHKKDLNVFLLNESNVTIFSFSVTPIGENAQNGIVTLKMPIPYVGMLISGAELAHIVPNWLGWRRLGPETAPEKQR